jgi:hypothetical protein
MNAVKDTSPKGHAFADFPSFLTQHGFILRAETWSACRRSAPA